MRRIWLFAFLVVLPLFFSSCATPPAREAVRSVDVIYSDKTVPLVRHDVFHIVAPGETLWRIGKTYNVDPEEIARVNNLKDVSTLKMGQRLTIPAAEPIKPVVTLYPSEKWKYIIIHHSATDEGSALHFYKYHRSKGWKDLGYHFVIDNGSENKQDGQIEVSPRWIKQQDGAHCQAGNMNSRGIGICLVGNFSKDRVSDRQMASLVYLVNELKNYYKIPQDHIMGHGQVKGAKTECPGKKFPWKEFWEKLNKNM